MLKATVITNLVAAKQVTYPCLYRSLHEDVIYVATGPHGGTQLTEGPNGYVGKHYDESKDNAPWESPEGFPKKFERITYPVRIEFSP